MYYVMRASAPSLHRESTDSRSLIHAWAPGAGLGPAGRGAGARARHAFRSDRVRMRA